MNRIVSFFLLISVFLSLVSCKRGSDPEITQPSSPTSTLMTQAVDLANQVDNIPYYGTVISSSAVQPVSSVTEDNKIIPLAYQTKGEENKFILLADRNEETGDGVYYHPDYFPPGYDPYVDGGQYVCSIHPIDVKRVDTFVDQIKRLKNEALATCKQLDTWVFENPEIALPIPPGLIPSHINYRYRINYDRNRDFVTIEKLYERYGADVHEYECMIVGYDPQGKLKVDGYTAVFTDNSVSLSSSVHYLEDSYYIIAGEGNEGPYITAVSCEDREWVTVSPQYEVIYDESTGNEIENITGINYNLTCIYNGYFVVLCNNQSSIVTSDRREVVTWYNDLEFLFSLDFFDGWRQVESKDQNSLIILTTEKDKFSFYTQTHHPDPDFLDREKLFFNLSYHSRSYPLLLFKRSNAYRQQNIYWTVDDAKECIGELKGILGLTPVEEYYNMLFKVIDEREDIVNSFKLSSDIVGCNITAEQFHNLYSSLVDNGISDEKITALANETAISFDSQQPDYEYFEFLDVSISGSGTFNKESLCLDLSSVSATIAPSVLLFSDKEYILTFFFTSNEGQTYLGSIKAYYSGNAMTFSDKTEISAENFPLRETEYTLQCYISDHLNNRISKIYTIPGTTNEEYDISTDELESVLTVNENQITLVNRKADKTDNEASNT